MNDLFPSPISTPLAQSIIFPTTPTTGIVSMISLSIRFLATFKESSHFVPPRIAMYGRGGSLTAI